MYVPPGESASGQQQYVLLLLAPRQLHLYQAIDAHNQAARHHAVRNAPCRKCRALRRINRIPQNGIAIAGNNRCRKSSTAAPTRSLASVFSARSSSSEDCSASTEAI